MLLSYLKDMNMNENTPSILILFLILSIVTHAISIALFMGVVLLVVTMKLPLQFRKVDY